MTLPIFPYFIGIDWNWTRSSMNSTRVLTARSGFEYRTQDWSSAKYKWSGVYQFLRANPANTEFQSMLAFCLQQQGQYAPFLFTDNQDNSVVNQPIGAGNGSSVQFPLIRSIGGYTEGNIVANAVSSVSVAGTPTGAYSLVQNGSYGLDTIQFNSAPASSAAITATFSYYFPVRFLQDDPEFGNFMNNLWELKKLDFQSVK